MRPARDMLPGTKTSMVLRTIRGKQNGALTMNMR